MALQKAMQRGERTVVVGEVPAAICASGAADVRLANIFQQFGEVVAVCLHPRKDGTAGWGTVTFGEPGGAARAIRAASVSVEIASTDQQGQYTAELSVQRATLAMESRALGAIQIGGRGPAPVRRRGHSSFRTSRAHNNQRALSPRGRASNAEIADRSALVSDTIVEALGEPRNSMEQSARDRAVECLVTDVPPRLWSAMQTLRKAPEERSQSDVSALVSMARHQQIGFINKLTGPEQRRVCAVLTMCILPVGHNVYVEGSTADATYIILHGAVTATTQQGGGGGRRRAQLLVGHAESEEDSDDDENNADREILVHEDAGVRCGGLSPRESAVSPRASGATAASTREHGSDTALGRVQRKSAAPIETAERRVGDFCVGQHFGELALLKPGSKRTATVVVREPSVLLQVKQPDFASAMQLRDEERVELEAQLVRLRQCPIFQDLPLRTLLDLAELAEYQCCPKDTVLCEQGAPATQVFVVLSGKVAYSAKIRRREVSPPRLSRPAPSPDASKGNKDQTAASAMSATSSIAAPCATAKISPGAPEAEYWRVEVGQLGVGAIVGADGLPPDGVKDSRSAAGSRNEKVRRYRWTTTTSNDVEVLKVRIHTLIHRAPSSVLERLHEYSRSELSRQSLEKAVRREQQWQQKRSELFVHITGKGQTQKQVELQEMWAERAAKASLTSHSTPERQIGSKSGTQNLSMHTMSSLRKRTQTIIFATGHQHKQEVRWIEKLKVRTAEMTELREYWRDDPALKKNALKTDWAKAHKDFVQTMVLYDQLARENWDPMTKAAAPADLGATSTQALLDGSGVKPKEKGGPMPTAGRKSTVGKDAKEVLLRNVKLNSTLYSVAFEETLVLCGSVGCADPDTQKVCGFGYLSWLYWVESLLERFESQLEDDGMAEHFKLVRVGTEGFKILAVPAPTAERSDISDCASNATKHHSGLAGSSAAIESSSVGSQDSVGSSSTASSVLSTSGADGGGASLAWLAGQLLQFGVWMLDEAKAQNDKADRVDRTTVNAHQIHLATNNVRRRPASPTGGSVGSDDSPALDNALDGLHYVHGGRKGLLRTHRVALRIGVASGQCAAYALGMSRPALFQLKGPVVGGAERLCNDADADCMLMSPAVEEMISKSVEGLTRVPMKIDKTACTAEERATQEAAKELEDVVVAHRALDEARKTGNIEMIRKAEQQLVIEQREAQEAVRAAKAATEHAKAQREKKLKALQAARLAQIESATGPKERQFGWRNGQRNTHDLTPRQLRGVDARRRLMSHRPKQSSRAQDPNEEDAGRPSTAPAIGSRNAGTGSEPKKIVEKEQTLKERGEGPAEATAMPLHSRRPQSARPVLQNETASAPVAPRRRERQATVGQSIKASPPLTPWHKRPQSAPARRIMARHRPCSANHVSAVASRKTKAQASLQKLANARRTHDTQIAGAKRPQHSRNERPASARPVLDSYAFAARA